MVDCELKTWNVIYCYTTVHLSYYIIHITVHEQHTHNSKPENCVTVNQLFFMVDQNLDTRIVPISRSRPAEQVGINRVSRKKYWMRTSGWLWTENMKCDILRYHITFSIHISQYMNNTHTTQNLKIVLQSANSSWLIKIWTREKYQSIDLD